MRIELDKTFKKSSIAFRDFLIISIIIILILVFLPYFIRFEIFLVFFKQYAGWRIIEIFTSTLVIFFGISIFTVLRWKELRFVVAQRAHAEQAQRESEERFKRMADYSQDGLRIVEHGKVVYINDRACEIFGSTRGELAKLSSFDMAVPEERKRLKDIFDDAERTGETPKEIRFWIQRKDGTRRCIHNRYSIAKDGDKIINSFVFTTDITNLMKATEELRKHRYHLEELVEERTQQLREINEELESFTYSVSHDLRAPLRAIRGFSDALLEDYTVKLDSAGKEYLGRIATSAEHMDTLINDLLAYSRLSRAELKPELIDLNTIVKEVLTQLEDEINNRNAEISVEAPLPTVMGHRATLIQALSNILTNALKFVSQGVQPKAKIWSVKKDETVRLLIKDNGIGIEPEHRDRIFRIFERLHGREAYPGTGVGLAIVRKGITRLGGKVGVESTPGKGSTFWIELPKK